MFICIIQSLSKHFFLIIGLAKKVLNILVFIYFRNFRNNLKLKLFNIALTFFSNNDIEISQ